MVFRVLVDDGDGAILVFREEPGQRGPRPLRRPELAPPRVRLRPLALFRSTGCLEGEVAVVGLPVLYGFLCGLKWRRSSSGVFSGFFRFGCFGREGEGFFDVGFCFPPLDGCLGEGLAVVPSPEQFFFKPLFARPLNGRRVSFRPFGRREKPCFGP
jgi:hypothetical protein